MERRRFAALDGWRGVGCLFVALFHAGILGHAYASATLRNSWPVTDFYFVLSGFVISHVYWSRLTGRDGLIRFAFARFARLWPMHAFALCVMIAFELVKLVVAHLHPGSLETPPFGGTRTVDAIFTNLAMVHALGIHHGETWNIPSWSVSIEFWSCLVFAGVMVLFPMRRWTLAALGFFSFWMLIKHSTSNFIGVSFQLGIFRGLMDFALGHFTWSAYRILKRGSVPLFKGGATLLEIGIVLVIFGYFQILDVSTLSYLGPLIFALFILIFAFEAGPISPLLKTSPLILLGTVSYSVYLLHSPVLWVLEQAGQHAGAKLFGHAIVSALPNGKPLIDLGSVYLNDALTVVYLGVTVALAVVTQRLIEVPGQAFFKSLGARVVARLGKADTGRPLPVAVATPQE